MPYIISNSDGSITYTLQDGVVDTSTFSVSMVGRGVTNFGEYFAQNTLRHLENFAGATAPENGIVGQLWYDKAANILRIWDGKLWRSSTGVVVGPEVARPTQNLAGTSFFNTTTNRLEIHDGSRFKEAGYAGEITSRYSSTASVQNPMFYGSRIRTLFLRAEDNRPIPVLAFSYVKTGNSPENRGATKIGEQYETIMALYSDEEFYIKTTGAGGTETLVDGVIVDFAPELLATNNNVPLGIAATRRGRPQGLILQGLNTRAEYEDSSIGQFNTLYANTIGTPSDPVNSITVNSLTILDDFTFAQDVNIDGTLTVNIANITGIIYASGSNSDVWANAVQPGDNVSVLTNDAGYVTEANVNTILTEGEYLTYPQLINDVDISLLLDGVNVSDLINDADYISLGSLTGGIGITYTDTTGIISITDTGVTSGTFGNSGYIPRITVNPRGQITSATEVLAVIPGIGLDLNLTSGELFLTNTGVNSGIYGSASAVPRITVNQQGRIVSVVEIPISGVAGGGDVTILTDLLDVSVSSPVTGNLLKYTGTAWQNSTITLGELSDVAGTTATIGQVLKWNGFQWTPAADENDAGGGSGGIELTDLSVVPLSASGGGSLIYSPSTGVFTYRPANVPTRLRDLSDVSVATPSTGQVLKWNGAQWAPSTDLAGEGGGGADLTAFSVGECVNPPNVTDSLGVYTTDNVLLWTNGSTVRVNLVASTSNPIASTINGWYLTDLNRPADQSGLNFWYNDWIARGEAAARTSFLQAAAQAATAGAVTQEVYSFCQWNALTKSGGSLDYNDSTGVFTYRPAKVPTSLRDLTDISGTRPEVGQVLKWNGFQWGPAADLTGEGGTGISFADLDGVTAGTPQGNGFLSYNKLTGVFTYRPANVPTRLRDLSDVSTTAPTTGQVLKWNGASWAPAVDLAGGGISLTDLSVSTGSALAGGSLSYNNSTGLFTFRPALIRTDLSQFTDNTGIVPNTLSDLDDVAATTPTVGQVLKWNGSLWAPGSDLTSEGGGSDLTAFSVITGSALAGGSLSYNNTSGEFTFNPASIPTDISQFTDDSNLLKTDISELNDSTGIIPINLEDLNNVSSAAPSSGQVLKWDGSQWAPGTDLTADSGSGITLEDLSVSTAATPVGGGSLSYASGVFTFTPADVPADISDLTDTTGIIPTDISDLTDSTGSIPTSLLDLTDVVGGQGTSGQVLTSSGTGAFSFQSVTSTSSISLTDFSVSISAALGGGDLDYDNTTGVFTFAPADVPESLNDLTDVTISGTPGTGQVLGWNGSQWAPTTVSSGSGGDVVGPSTAINNAIAIFDGTTGKIIKDSGKLLPTGAVVGTTDTQTLSAKSFSDFLRLSGGAGTTQITLGPASVMAFEVNSARRMVIDTAGSVGIGIDAPTNKLHVVGNIFATQNIVAASDQRLKENIAPLDGSKVYEMQGVSFTRRDTGNAGSGVIAQDLELVAPELVHTDSLGFKSVAYGNIVGYLIEAIKDLKAETLRLHAEITELKNNN
jgi:hypothetical protein